MDLVGPEQEDWARATRMLICGVVLADALRTGKRLDPWFGNALKMDIDALKDKAWSVEEWAQFWGPALKLGLFKWT